MYGTCESVSRGEEVSQVGNTRQTDFCDLRAVGDQSNGPGILQLVSDFALAVTGIQQRRNSTGEGGSVKRDSVFPSVRKIDGDDLTGLDANTDQASCDP